jgi:ribosome-binding ATPase YchF (GTP1/OBG family)
VKVGIVGLPNAGKSTLFNALTRAGAQAAEYPFTTVEPNVAVVPVPDERLDRIADALGIERRVPEQIEFVDVAGLVKGAHEGEGLGNRFLGQIRDVDAILHVVRCFEDPQVAHPHGEVDPVADLETVEAELLLADLESAERRLADAARRAGGGVREARAGADFWEGVVESIRAGLPAPAEAGLITSKPTLVVANVGEGESAPPALGSRGPVAVCALDEAELRELAPDEAAAMRHELGLDSGALEEVVRAAYELLGLVTFFTAVGATEVRARSLERGSTALGAAGKVHTDMERGFIRAEVIEWDELVEAGSLARARELGKLRTEGRDYVVEDGDVLTIKFSPT